MPDGGGERKGNNGVNAIISQRRKHTLLLLQFTHLKGIKVKMAGGGGGACLGLWHGTCPPPTTQVNCFGRLHCAGGGGGGRGEQLIEIIKARHKKHAPPITSLSQYWCKSGTK